MKTKKTYLKREIRKRKNRAKIRKTDPAALRLSIFRSNKYIYAQLIDDSKGATLAAANSKELKGKMTKTEQAIKVGELIGDKIKKLGIKKILFDRGSYKYHGRVKALIDEVEKKLKS